jgi:predicted dehydrogenase
MDWGIYTAHTILHLMGPVDTVYANTAQFRKEVMVRDQLVPDIDVEDTVSATLRFESGAMGVWYAAWAVAAAHGTMSIDGSLGSIVNGRNNQGISVYSNKLGDPEHLRGWREIAVTEPPLADRHYRKLAHLIDAVLDGTPLIVTGADGRDALELVLAVYASAETGQPVTLPLPRPRTDEPERGERLPAAS